MDGRQSKRQDAGGGNPKATPKKQTCSDEVSRCVTEDKVSKNRTCCARMVSGKKRQAGNAGSQSLAVPVDGGGIEFVVRFGCRARCSIELLPPSVEYPDWMACQVCLCFLSERISYDFAPTVCRISVRRTSCFRSCSASQPSIPSRTHRTLSCSSSAPARHRSPRVSFPHLRAGWGSRQMVPSPESPPFP